MAEPRKTDPNRQGGSEDKRPRSSGRGLIISIVIIILVLIGYLFWDPGPQAPSDEAVAPQGESPQTEAPAGTEPSPPEVPAEVPETAPQQ